MQVKKAIIGSINILKIIQRNLLIDKLKLKKLIDIK